MKPENTFRHYADLLAHKELLEAELNAVKQEISAHGQVVTQLMEELGLPKVQAGQYNLGFKTIRAAKLKEGANRYQIAQQLKNCPHTNFLVKEDFNLNQLSAFYRAEEQRFDHLPEGLEYYLPEGLEWKEYIVLNPTKARK